MGVHVHRGTMPDGVTPICNECGISLCWDISEEDYAKDREFWDGWICQDCNGGKPLSLSAHQARKANGQTVQQYGALAKELCGVRLPLQVLCCNKGFYLGTATDAGPFSRESVEYWPTMELAQKALATPNGIGWTQRDEP